MRRDDLSFSKFDSLHSSRCASFSHPPWPSTVSLHPFSSARSMLDYQPAPLLASACSLDEWSRGKQGGVRSTRNKDSLWFKVTRQRLSKGRVEQSPKKHPWDRPSPLDNFRDCSSSLGGYSKDHNANRGDSSTLSGRRRGEPGPLSLRFGDKEWG